MRPYELQDVDGVRAWLADHKILDPEGPDEMLESLSDRKEMVHGASVTNGTVFARFE